MRNISSWFEYGPYQLSFLPSLQKIILENLVNERIIPYFPKIATLEKAVECLEKVNSSFYEKKVILKLAIFLLKPWYKEGRLKLLHHTTSNLAQRLESERQVALLGRVIKLLGLY